MKRYCYYIKYLINDQKNIHEKIGLVITYLIFYVLIFIIIKNGQIADKEVGYLMYSNNILRGQYYANIVPK